MNVVRTMTIVAVGLATWGVGVGVSSADDPEARPGPALAEACPAAEMPHLAQLPRGFLEHCLREAESPSPPGDLAPATPASPAPGACPAKGYSVHVTVRPASRGRAVEPPIT